MAVVRRNEFTITRAQGCWVWSQDGRRYLDATSSLWYANVGHNRAEIIEAIYAQANHLSVYSVFGDFSNEPAYQLAERLGQIAPLPNPRVFFGTGGGDAIETAAKLARRYWHISGGKERNHIITRDKSYHGTHGFGTSIGGIAANTSGYGPLIADHSTVPWDSAEALESEIRRVGPERIAAFFCEPVMGAGGVYPPAPGYMQRVSDICRHHGIPLVIDSVICGFGRLGDWFGVERWGIRPDMVTFAKGVTSGHLPLGGVIVSESLAAPFWEDDGQVFNHGPTYAGHPTCCAAALANLEVLENEGLLERSRILEPKLFQILQSLGDHPAVAEVRGGVGLLGAIEIAPDLLEQQPSAVRALQLAIRSRGVLVRPLGTSVAVSPPLVIEDEQLKLIGEAVRDGLDLLSRGS